MDSKSPTTNPPAALLGLGKWSYPTYADRTVYNSAGKVFVKGPPTTAAVENALGIIGDWRAAHQYPLHAIAMTLRGRAHEIDPDCIIAQRSKRLASIIPKLMRMRLTQIQDIGGCRAVVKDMKRLLALHKVYIEAKKDLRRPYMDGDPSDYIQHPKKDGYRGIHYVYRYRSIRERYAVFNEMKIEIQIRTRAQHAWATALEIVDLFTGQKLKTDIDTNQANPDWKKFFRLINNNIAINEGCPYVPETPTNPKELRRELRDVVRKLRAVTLLEGFGKAVKHIETLPSKTKGGAFIVRLDTRHRLLRTIPYDGKSMAKLEADYLQMEKEALNEHNVQVVQVKVDSLDQLKRAYPNYDLDTTVFVNTVLAAYNP